MLIRLVKFVFHFIVLPAVCAIVGMAVHRSGVLQNVTAVPVAGPFLGGYFDIMGAAFVSSFIAIALDRLIFFPLYKAMRRKEYVEGEYGPPM